MPTRDVRANPTGPWLLTLDFLPPSVNHSHYNLNGRRARTKAATSAGDAIAMETLAAGFTPSLEAFYAVSIVYTFPTWGHDIDGRIKPTLDAIFGARYDHRIVHLEVSKLVQSGTYRALVRITQVGEWGFLGATRVGDTLVQRSEKEQEVNA